MKEYDLIKEIEKWYDGNFDIVKPPKKVFINYFSRQALNRVMEVVSKMNVDISFVKHKSFNK